MMESIRVAVACLLIYLSVVQCAENAGSGVATRLIPCYNTSAIPGITSADRRPPATVNVLVEYIRKLEDANPNMSPQQLSVQLLQRFRQDGIKRDYKSPENNRYSIPYSPLSFEASRNKVLLTKLIPDVEQNLELGDLSPLQMCSLHYMISSTVDRHLRGDEDTVCARTSRYSSRIIKRKRRDLELTPREFGVEDVNTLSKISACPLEQGVVFTNYGTVKGGNVLAGIASGMNPQNYLRDVDNRYASTIAGDLTEASLYQSTEQIQVGAPGGWNSTINPKYYFLQKNNLLQATDAEIRGGLDGLFMALSMTSWKTKFQDLTISQIIDMYYSPYQTGLFDSGFKACNRNILYNEFVTAEKLQTQVYNFMSVLNAEATFTSTKTNESFNVYSKAAVDTFSNYLPQMSTGDPSCQPDDSSIQRTAADLLIFVDFNWPYDTIQPLLSFILDNIDVNKFGSRYTLFNGQDTHNITNTTSYLSDFYEKFNQSIHDTQAKGFDYIGTLKKTEELLKDKLNNNSYSGGDSNVVLLAPRNPPSENERSYIQQRRKIFSQYLPDLKFVVLTSAGNADDYASLVTNPSKDVTIHNSDGANEDTLKQTGLAVVKNIRSIPRSLVNPACGSGFSGSSSTTFVVTGYVEPNGVNYYRISPNYFFEGSDDNRNLKVTDVSFGNINFCYSRDQEQPNNQTGQCYSMRNGEQQSVSVKNFCDDSISGCSPIYIAISGNSSDVNCRDDLCRFPVNIKYTVSLENVGCASSGSLINAKLLVMIAVIAVGCVTGKFHF